MQKQTLKMVYNGNVNSHVFQLYLVTEKDAATSPWYRLVFSDAAGSKVINHKSMDTLLNLIGGLFKLPSTGTLPIPKELMHQVVAT